MSDLYTLADIMGGPTQGRFFSIPDYQRGYSWQDPHREDLLSDISDLANHQAMHFTGTIVAAGPENANDTFSVVDGQQRLTTLLLLIGRLLLKLETNDVRALNNGLGLEAAKAQYLVTGTTGNEVARLALNGDTARRFEQLITKHDIDSHSRPSQNKADDNLVDAAEQFNRWLSEHSPQSLCQIFDLVTQRLGFLFYSPRNTLEVGLMFEVINSRGKPLSELEKVKNFLIFYADRHEFKKLHEQVNATWRRILTALNSIGLTTNGEERSFLRACWVVFGDPSPRPRNPVYETLRLKVAGMDENEGCKFLQAFVEVLEYGAETYRCLYSQTSNHALSVDAETHWLRSLAFHPRLAGVLPLIVALDQKEPGHDNLDLRAQTLELIEKLNFRYFVLGIAPRVDSSQGELFEMAHRYFHAEQNAAGDVIDNAELQKMLKRFIGQQAKVGSVIKHLVLEADENWDFYEWNGLKFFLASYEQNLKEKRKEGCSLPALLRRRDREAYNDFYHLEHLVAQHHDEHIEDEWVDYLQRRLGNFVLLREGTNKAVAASRVEEKVSGKYRSSDHTMLYQVRELEPIWKAATKYTFSVDGLNWKNSTTGSRTQVLQRFGDLREEELVRFALSRWHVPAVDGELPIVVSVQSTHRRSNEYGADLHYAKAG